MRAVSNHISHVKQEHKVGKTITTEQSEFGGLLDMFSTKSYFKYDGEKIWDYLHKHGIRIDTSIQGKRLGMAYDVTFKGKKLARIEMINPKGGNNIIAGAHWFEVTAEESDLDMAFLTAFAIARTEQTFYN